MLAGSYGKEPFDLRLTVLRMLRSMDKIMALTLAGTLLFGGGYYLKNVLLGGERLYCATSTYKVEYSDPQWAQYGTYINGVTWNTHMHTDEFLDMVQAHLKEQGEQTGQKWEISREELSGMLTAQLPSDLRVPTTSVTSPLPEKSMAVAAAVEAAMTEDFAEAAEEISAIRVISHGDTVQEVLPDARPVRAFVLSALLSFFFTVVLLLLKETGDDSIWLPSSIRKRYGLPVLGTVNSAELAANAAYLFRGKRKIAVCAMDVQTDPVKVADLMQERVRGAEAQQGREDSPEEEWEKEWIPVPSPLLSPEVCGNLRKMDGILLAVTAGSHAGKPLEYVLEYLEQQDCKITAVILWDADEFLIKSYYCFRDGNE